MHTWAPDIYEEKLLEEILHRVERELKIKNANNDDKKKLITNEMLECYNDCVYFIENYLYTDKNPFFFSMKIQTLVPYMLFDFQVETVDKIIKAIET